MKISIISDEISYDFHTAFELAETWNINTFEIRKLGLDRIPDHDPLWDDVIRSYVRDKGVTISALSPGLFKLKRSDKNTPAHVNERFAESLQLAEKLSCPRIVIFAFQYEENEDPESPPQEVIDILGSKGDDAQKSGIELAIEISPGSFAQTGRSCRILMEKLQHPNIKVNWDPANTVRYGNVPLNGYNEVSGMVSSVHVKDTDGEKIITVGTGLVDWKGMAEALHKDGFTGYLTLETHMKPRLTGTKGCLDGLRKAAGRYLE